MVDTFGRKFVCSDCELSDKSCRKTDHSSHKTTPDGTRIVSCGQAKHLAGSSCRTSSTNPSCWLCRTDSMSCLKRFSVCARFLQATWLIRALKNTLPDSRSAFHCPSEGCTYR